MRNDHGRSAKPAVHTLQIPVQVPQRRQATDGHVQIRLSDGRADAVEAKARQLFEEAAPAR